MGGFGRGGCSRLASALGLTNLAEHLSQTPGRRETSLQGRDLATGSHLPAITLMTTAPPMVPVRIESVAGQSWYATRRPVPAVARCRPCPARVFTGYGCWSK
jgi:hypothetical protein